MYGTKKNIISRPLYYIFQLVSRHRRSTRLSPPPVHSSLATAGPLVEVVASQLTAHFCTRVSWGGDKMSGVLGR